MLGFLGCWNSSHAQQVLRISGAFKDLEVKSILIQLEEAYPIKFFFRDSDLPELPVSIVFENEYLLDACQRLLAGNDLQIFPFKESAIVIVPKNFEDRLDTTQISLLMDTGDQEPYQEEEMGELYQLETVTISSLEEASLKSVSGLASLTRMQIEALPVFMGEPDLMKSILFIPGVSTLGEGAVGINVRGGNTDENLILLGGNALFNANHAFGFFGSVNTGLIQEVKLYKGAMPSYYGGRLSSVIDIKMKEASTEVFKLEGSIGPLSGKLLAEVPLKKGVNALHIGGRSLYSDWLLGRVNIPEVKNSAMFFYDLNINYVHHLTPKSTLRAEFYTSSDDFQFSEEFGFAYASKAANVQLSNPLGKKLNSDLSLAYNAYQSTKRNLAPNLNSGFDTDISYYKLKEQARYQASEFWTWDMGGEIIYYRSNPGKQYALEGASNEVPFNRAQEQALEAAAFINGEAKLGDRLSLMAGLRFSHYKFLGPGQRYVYEDETNPTRQGLIDSVSYGSRIGIANYSTPEPRLSINYLLSPSQSLKGAYGKSAQYIFQLSSFDSAIPTDAWTLSNYFLRPQRADNLSLEYAKNWQEGRWVSSIGTYYRWIKDLKDYVDFAELMSPNPLETEIVHADARAYGLEFNVKKTTGDFQMNISYTLARTEWKTQSALSSRSINENNWYPANYDKPHDLRIFLNYRFNQRKSLAITFNYASGRPTTAPIGYFDIDGQSRTPIYSARNQLRIPEYHRLDIAYTIGKSKKRQQNWKGSWTFGIYNVYGRRNAYSVFFTQARFASSQANRLSVLGSAFPAISYNFTWSKL